MALQVLQTPRFAEAYRKANLVAQRLVEGAIWDARSAYRSQPATFMHRYDRHARLRDVLEIDVSGGWRLLAQLLRDYLILLDFGPHEIVARYTQNKLIHDLTAVTKDAVKFQLPRRGESALFASNPRSDFEVFGTELSNEWIYFLAEEQDTALVTLATAFDGLTDGFYAAHFILGGPGTGKTSILLQLLKYFADSKIPVWLDISDALHEYITACVPALNLRNYCDEANRDSASVLLIDDPGSSAEVLSLLENMKFKPGGMLVVAFDPCQLGDALTDAALDNWVERYGITLHELTTCYRQKEVVGRRAVAVAETVARSTPFLAKEKVGGFRQDHQRLTALANGIRFINPYGYEKVFEDATLRNWRAEVRRIISLPLWRHWHPLLVVLAEDRGAPVTLAPEWERALSPLDFQVVRASQMEDIKGLEYQHVFIVISSDLYDQLNQGFRGSGQPLYLARRQLRIPFSRAKDSLVTFVV